EYRFHSSHKIDSCKSRASSPRTPAHVAAHPYAPAVRSPTDAHDERQTWQLNLSFLARGQIKHLEPRRRFHRVCRLGTRQVFAIRRKTPRAFRSVIRRPLRRLQLGHLSSRQIEAEESL